MIHTVQNYHKAGEQGRAHEVIHWMGKVWDEREETKVLKKDEFVKNLYERIVNFDRFELGVFKVAGNGVSELIAASAVTFDTDVHVGLVLSVEAAYSIERAGGRELRKLYNEIARGGGAKMIRLIKREGPYRYSVRYVEVKG